MQTLLGKHWHHLPTNQVLVLLETDLECGLDHFEVQHRQQHFGSNLLTPRKGKGPLQRFLLQFRNPLVYILLAAAIITALVKDVVDAVIIGAVVLVNAVIGFVQESKAEEAIEALTQAMTTEAAVLRAGDSRRIPAGELVPGDVVSFRAGDKVPADVRLVRSRDLQIAEAALTGESMPVHKVADVLLDPSIGLADRRNMAYASTLVTYGQGTGIVTAIGDSTEVGRISELISTAEEVATPLTRKIARFSQTILYVILALAAVIFGIGVLRGQPALDTLTAAIALAVAMIPEGLPAALTVTLAIGVSRMARRQAIIRKLPAVETLGSVTVICSDKTGTLTQNEMTVQQIVTVDACYQVTGSGYAPQGQVLDQAGTVVSVEGSSALYECLRAGVLCNDSQLVEEAGTWKPQGDPTEVALLVSAHKGGFANGGSKTSGAWLPRIDGLPFESEHQYMATLHSAGAEQPRPVYAKGAMEILLERCVCSLDASGQQVALDADRIRGHAEEMASQGLRVLAFARGELPASAQAVHHSDLTAGLTYLGLQGMIDPPRTEALAAVQACQKAGIFIKMITGDHVLTASAIAQQLGLQGKAREGDAVTALTGQDLKQLSDTELLSVADSTSVFARVSPEQKLRLVEALQARGHVVAMTGDGVNDGPALKQSDIGVAMGITGTDVAKEAADMVLTDDNFATIEAAIEEGRGVFDNLTKIISWTLPTNLGEGLIILAAILAGVALPILPVHILWINMTTVSVLGIVLALEAKEKHIMDRPPREPQAPILTGTLMARIAIVGVLILLGAFGLFEWELSRGASIEAARTVAVNVVVVIEIFYLFNCRSLTQSMFQVGLLSNPWVVVGVVAMATLQLLFTYVPTMNQIFLSAPIDLAAWGRILLVGLGGYLFIEVEKWGRRWKQQ